MCHTQLELALSKVDDWQFDSFELERATNGRPLSVLAFALIKNAGLSTVLNLDERKLARYVRNHRPVSLFCLCRLGGARVPFEGQAQTLAG